MVVSVVEKGRLLINSRLDVVDAFHVGDVRPQAEIGEFPVLGDRLRIQRWRKIREGISARIEVVLVLASETTKRKQRVRTDNVRPSGRDVISYDLRALVAVAEESAVQRVEGLACGIADESGAAGVQLLVEGIGVLKPGTREAEVAGNPIPRLYPSLHPIDNLLL